MTKMNPVNQFYYTANKGLKFLKFKKNIQIKKKNYILLIKENILSDFFH